MSPYTLYHSVHLILVQDNPHVSKQQTNSSAKNIPKENDLNFKYFLLSKMHLRMRSYVLYKAMSTITAKTQIKGQNIIQTDRLNKREREKTKNYAEVLNKNKSHL